MNPSRPKTFPPIPSDTVKAARAIFGRSNFYLVTGDRANRLFDGLMLEDPSGQFLQPPRTLAMLYLITIFQFVETMPDHQAADAVRKRTDWKYALHLPLTYPGLQAELFCDFRHWLKIEASGRQTLQALLLGLSEVVEFERRNPETLTAEQVIAVVCRISRLANVWEALHQAMQALANRRPGWLVANSRPHWILRYGAQRRHLDLAAEEIEDDTLAREIGADGRYLLDAVSKSGDPELASLTEVRALRQLWSQQFEDDQGEVVWITPACSGCSSLGQWPESGPGPKEDG